MIKTCQGHDLRRLSLAYSQRGCFVQNKLYFLFLISSLCILLSCGKHSTEPQLSPFSPLDPPPVPAQILVEGGSFTFHNLAVQVDSFYMDKYEVKQDHYNAVVYGFRQTDSKQNDIPVYYVSWYDAIKYCNLRSELEGFTPVYSYKDYGTDPGQWPKNWDNPTRNRKNLAFDRSASGYRLPTEAEWEYAAGGGKLSQHREFCGDDSLNLVGWHKTNSGFSVHPVGWLRPNELGFYDMSGNLWEWCWDSSPSSSSPHHPAYSGHKRALRGGAYNVSEHRCRVQYRYWALPQIKRSPSIGFRVCRKAG